MSLPSEFLYSLHAKSAEKIVSAGRGKSPRGQGMEREGFVFSH